MGNICKDLERPPMRNSIKLSGIIEIVCMIICGIFSLVKLINIFTSDIRLNDIWTIIQIIVYVIIFAGLIMVVYGLFCTINQAIIKAGIVCFLLGTILSFVTLVYQIINKIGITLYGIFYMILLLLLGYILWRQLANI